MSPTIFIFSFSRCQREFPLFGHKHRDQKLCGSVQIRNCYYFLMFENRGNSTTKYLFLKVNIYIMNTSTNLSLLTEVVNKEEMRKQCANSVNGLNAMNYQNSSCKNGIVFIYNYINIIHI